MSYNTFIDNGMWKMYGGVSGMELISY